jgi:hypothetical protein
MEQCISIHIRTQLVRLITARGLHILFRTSSKWLYLIVPLVVYGAGIYCTLKFETDWTARQTWAVVLTGFVLIWYTWETMLLRQVAFLQRELQLRPFVVFRKEGQKYVVENVGNATALGVRIDEIIIGESTTKLEIRFPSSLPLLKPGAVADVEIDVLINGKYSDSTFAAHLDPKYAIQDVDIHIHFSNIEGKQYSLTEIVSPQTLAIKGFHNEPAL